MFGNDPHRCEICGTSVGCGRCFDGPCGECLKLEFCSDCAKAVQAAREQRDYLRNLYAGKKQ